MAYSPNDTVTLRQLLELGSRAKAHANTKEASNNKVKTINSQSTDTQYPSAKAVYALFNSITNANEVSY